MMESFDSLRGACAEHFGCAQCKLAEAFRMTFCSFVTIFEDKDNVFG
jgi:hypothetical protein